MIANQDCSTKGLNITATGKLYTDGYEIFVGGASVQIEAGADLSIVGTSNFSSSCVTTYINGTLNMTATTNITFGVLEIYSGGVYNASSGETLVTNHTYVNGTYTMNGGNLTSVNLTIDGTLNVTSGSILNITELINVTYSGLSIGNLTINSSTLYIANISSVANLIIEGSAVNLTGGSTLTLNNSNTSILYSSLETTGANTELFNITIFSGTFHLNESNVSIVDMINISANSSNIDGVIIQNTTYGLVFSDSRDGYVNATTIENATIWAIYVEEAEVNISNLITGNTSVYNIEGYNFSFIEAQSNPSTSGYFSISKFINITNTSTGSVNITFSYTSLSNEANAKVYRHNGSLWSEVTSTVDTTNNLASASDVTTFSTFSVLSPLFSDGVACSDASNCTGGYCVHSICRSGSTYCGDGYCDLSETSSSCSSDCTVSSSGGSASSSTTASKTSIFTDVVSGQTLIVKPASTIIKVTEITAIAAEDKASAKITVKNHDSRPASVSTPSSKTKVYQYLDITSDVAIKSAEVKFEVSDEWLNEQGAKSNDVVLLHYDGDNWNELPTEHISGEEYKATAPSFSTFAISAKVEEAEASAEEVIKGIAEKFSISRKIGMYILLAVVLIAIIVYSLYKKPKSKHFSEKRTLKDLGFKRKR